MLILATVTDQPELSQTFAGLTILSILYALAIFLISCLILWFIIYTAVRAALSSDRRQQAQDAAHTRQIAIQRGH